MSVGVSDGARTRDNRDHNPVLYQLSYTHHGAAKSIPASGCDPEVLAQSGTTSEGAGVREAPSASPPSTAAAAAAASAVLGPGCGTNTTER